MQAYNYRGGFGSLDIPIRAPCFRRKDCMKQVLSKVGFQKNTGRQARRGPASWDERGALVCFLGAKFYVCQCKLLDCFKSANKCLRKGTLY